MAANTNPHYRRAVTFGKHDGCQLEIACVIRVSENSSFDGYERAASVAARVNTEGN
jgi:hypothetical protein